MKRLFNWGVLVAVPLLLLALSASAGAGSAAGKAKPVRPQTLVVENGLIRAFAQDGNVIAWSGRGYKVHVRSLSARMSSIVGSAAPPAGAGVTTPALALAGTRALWTKFEGGNSLENSLWTSTLGGSATGIDLFMGGSGDPGGSFLTGAAGDGPTLLYGRTDEICPEQLPPGTPCRTLEASGGVRFVTGQYEPPPISGIPAPAMLAFAAHDPRSGRISQGLLAVAPAASPLLTDLGKAPRVAENGPVQIYRFLNKAVLVSSIAPQGRVRALALSFGQLAVLMERANGGKAIERYDPQSGRRIGVTAVPSTTATELSISSAGLIYRIGRRIYLFTGSAAPRLVWQTSATPIGLSIEGRRIAWAVNIKGRGRIVASTLP